ncbi:MAG: arylamine N-acetyltransferase [Acidimicrobiaceae bacterium]|nr:arylamine N-acetyltransferase [Acidimicrobiaceae bacterium]
MDPRQIDAYLDRIGASYPKARGADELRELHAAHLRRVPFENLSIHLGEPIRLDEDALIDKIVTRQRGGFCYELNGAFAALLSALGFEVTLLAARVFSGNTVGPPFDHLVLRVDISEPWLADVGFGRHTLWPLRLDARGPQADPGGTFTLTESGEGDLDVLTDHQPQYRVELRGRAIDDFEPMCWWHQTSPKSHFTRSLTCSLPTASGRTTLSDRLLIRTSDGQRHETLLDDDGEVLAAYRDHFGIVIDRAPHVRA